MKEKKPGVSKGCCLEVKYSRTSKKHSFVTPGKGMFLRRCVIDFIRISRFLDVDVLPSRMTSYLMAFKMFLMIFMEC